MDTQTESQLRIIGQKLEALRQELQRTTVFGATARTKELKAITCELLNTTTNTMDRLLDSVNQVQQ